MATRKRKSRVGKINYSKPRTTTHNNPQINYSSYLLIVCLVVVVTLCVTTSLYMAKNEEEGSSNSKMKQKIPSRKLIELAKQYAYLGDFSAFKQLVKNDRTFNWSLVQQEGPASATLLHGALQGRHDSISMSSASLSGDHEVRDINC